MKRINNLVLSSIFFFKAWFLITSRTRTVENYDWQKQLIITEDQASTEIQDTTQTRGAT